MRIDPNRIRVDVTFGTTGGLVPRDHGHALFAALNRALGDLHGADWLAVHPLRGVLRPDGLLDLAPERGTLRLRLLPAALPRVLPLSGAALSVLGCTIHLGPAHIHTLTPTPALESRLVVMTGLTEPAPFTEALQQRMAERGIAGRLQLGRRRVLGVGGRRIVGFGVGLRELPEESSLLLLYEGLGGRQRLGCGVFFPVAEESRPAGWSMS